MGSGGAGGGDGSGKGERDGTAAGMGVKVDMKPPSPPPKRGPIFLLLGGTASMMAATCTHPLDLLKVRLQTASNAAGGAPPRGLVQTAVMVVRNDGFRALYRGLTASLGRQGTYSTTRFAVYDFLKAKFSEHKADGQLNTAERFATAMGAGGVGGVVGTPMDVCNVRMQDDGRLPKAQRRNYKHVGDALVRIIREEGVAKLYSGLGPNVIRAMLMTAGQLASYDTFKQLLLTKTSGVFTDNLITHFTASTLAGGVATMLTQPVDVVKTRVMAAQPGTYSSALACAGSTLKTEGPLAFFKGTVPAFTRLGPQTILTFVFLEQLRRLHAHLTGDPKP